MIPDLVKVALASEFITLNKTLNATYLLIGLLLNQASALLICSSVALLSSIIDFFNSKSIKSIVKALIYSFEIKIKHILREKKIIDKYNAIPLVTKVNPDLTDYTTNKALEGVFKMIAVEEKEIRSNS